MPCGLFRFIDIELKQPFGTSTGKPSVSFEIPKSNQQFLPGDDIEVTVNASDNGSVSDVKLYLNNQLVREEKSAPYPARWTRPPLPAPPCKTRSAPGAVSATCAGRRRA